MEKNRLAENLEPQDMPRERMLEKGPQALTDYELLAILLRTGVAGENVLQYSQRILHEMGGLRGLCNADPELLSAVDGIGPAKATTILAVSELGRRISRMYIEPDDRTRIETADDVYELMRYDMTDLDHEELWVLSLNTKNILISRDMIYKGTINTSSVRVAEIFRKPLLHKAASLIMVHNHPSGNPQPSAADIMTTRAARDAGRLLDIQVVDHVVIGKGKFVSIRSYLD